VGGGAVVGEGVVWLGWGGGGEGRLGVVGVVGGGGRGGVGGGWWGLRGDFFSALEFRIVWLHCVRRGAVCLPMAVERGSVGEPEGKFDVSRRRNRAYKDLRGQRRVWSRKRCRGGRRNPPIDSRLGNLDRPGQHSMIPARLGKGVGMD